MAEDHEAGTGRVTLSFTPAGQDFRVPPGVTVFDAASWNGIAIDSTCGGHGTCKKCKVRITEGEVPVSKLDSRAFTPDELRDQVATMILAGHETTAISLAWTFRLLAQNPRAEQILQGEVDAGDLAGPERTRAEGLVASCAECGLLRAELQGIRGAIADLPVPARRRTFALSHDAAASLRAAGWRRLLAPLAAPRFAPLAPLGGIAATLGLVGLLLTGGVGVPEFE